MAGQYVNKNNKELNNLINEFNLRNKITLLGELNNTKSFFRKIDYFVLSSSFGESFPNVIAGQC